MFESGSTMTADVSKPTTIINVQYCEKQHPLLCDVMSWSTEGVTTLFVSRDVNQNEVMMSTFKIQGGIEDLAHAPV